MAYEHEQIDSKALTEMNDTRSAQVSALMAQALHTSERGELEELIALLHQVLALDADHATARHLLGAALAQVGRIDEALVEFQRAVERNPTMAVARFQYGLLLHTAGQLAAARAQWSQLASLGEHHVLNRFATAMEQVTEGRYDEARRVVLVALTDNKDLPVINRDLQVLLEALPPVEEHMDTAITATHGTHHVLLSSYQQPDAME